MKFSQHFFLRKRSNKYEPYPARRVQLRLLDNIVFVVGILGPLMTIPQIWLVFSTHDASGVSALSFGMWALMDIPWIIYGFAHRQGPIIWTYILWCVCNGLVCIGALLYG